jgi:hypothetical protein
MGVLIRFALALRGRIDEDRVAMNDMTLAEKGEGGLGHPLRMKDHE